MNPISGKNWRAGASLIAGLIVVIAVSRIRPAWTFGKSIEC
jgi:hypothetical protein